MSKPISMSKLGMSRAKLLLSGSKLSSGRKTPKESNRKYLIYQWNDFGGWRVFFPPDYYIPGIGEGRSEVFETHRAAKKYLEIYLRFIHNCERPHFRKFYRILQVKLPKGTPYDKEET